MGLTGPALTLTVRDAETQQYTQIGMNRGRSEAEDLTLQHSQPSLAVEDQCSSDRDLHQLPREEARAHCMPDLRHVRQASRSRRLIR